MRERRWFGEIFRGRRAAPTTRKRLTAFEEEFLGEEFIIGARRVDGVGEVSGEFFRELEAREAYWRVESRGVDVGVVAKGEGFRGCEGREFGR